MQMLEIEENGTEHDDRDETLEQQSNKHNFFSPRLSSFLLR